MSKCETATKKRATTRKPQPASEFTYWQKIKVFIDGLKIITWLVDQAQKFE